MNIQFENRILRIKQVTEITGLCRSSIYAYINGGNFPQQRKLGTRAVGWLAEDVFEWVSGRDVVEL